MKGVIVALFLMLGMMVPGCKENDLEEIELTKEQIVPSVWKGQLIDDNNNVIIENLTIWFVSNQYCWRSIERIPDKDIVTFPYYLVGKELTFTDDLIGGNWWIVSYTGETLILENNPQTKNGQIIKLFKTL